MYGQGPEKTRRGSRKSGRGTQGGCSGLLQSKTSIDTHTITWTKGGDRRGAQGGHMTSNDVVCSHVPHWWWCSGLDVSRYN